MWRCIMTNKSPWSVDTGIDGGPRNSGIIKWSCLPASQPAQVPLTASRPGAGSGGLLEQDARLKGSICRRRRGSFVDANATSSGYQCIILILCCDHPPCLLKTNYGY